MGSDGGHGVGDDDELGLGSDAGSLDTVVASGALVEHVCHVSYFRRVEESQVEALQSVAGEEHPAHISHLRSVEVFHAI